MIFLINDYFLLNKFCDLMVIFHRVNYANYVNSANYVN